MALNSTTVWEVRTTGDAANGGGFANLNDGTSVDYSQQDTAQLSLTDLAMTTGGTTLTSSTGGFTAAMEGNLIYIASGTNFTAGYYQITGYTDTNTVTLDRDATDGSNGSSGNGKVGGALLTIAAACDNMVAQNSVWIKSGTYNETMTWDAGNSSTQYPTLIQGYNSTRGDAPIGDNRPVIDRSSGTGNVMTFSSQYYILKNFRITGVATNSAIVIGSYNVGFINVKLYSNAYNVINSGTTTYGPLFLGCEFSSCSHAGIECRGPNLISCYSHDNTQQGVANFGNPSNIYYNCVIESNSGNGISYGTKMLINCSIYNNTGANVDGVNAVNYNLSPEYCYINNILVDNSRYGFITTGYANCLTFDFNCYNGNGTAGLSSNITAGDNDITSSPSFTDAPNGDFSLSTGSPALNTGLMYNTWTSAT